MFGLTFGLSKQIREGHMLVGPPGTANDPGLAED